MLRQAVGGIATVVVLLVPGVADGHTMGATGAEKALARQAGKAALPPHTAATEPRISGVRSDCRRVKRSAGHGHVTTCRLAIAVTDWASSVEVARRTCRDASVRVRMSRQSRKLKVAWRTFQPTCRLTGRQPLPVPDVPPPGLPGADAPSAEGAPPAATPSPPPGAPSGPPPGAASAGAQAAASSSTRRSSSTLAAQSNVRPGGAPYKCTPWVIDPWYRSYWVYACWWHQSSAPPGAHIIGWQTSYYEVWYWTGTHAALWLSGTM